MSLHLTIELTDEQIEEIARRTAEIMRGDRPYTVIEAAEALRWSRNTIYRLIEAGEIATVPGGSKRIPVSEIKRLLKAQTKEDA